MNTSELAKELDSLARSLRGLTSEASEAVAVELFTPYRNSSDANKKLTVAAIANAIARAQQAAGPRATQLRQDVFDRRIEKLSTACAGLLASRARARAGAQAGAQIVYRFKGVTTDQAYYGDVAKLWDRSLINAQIHAWHRALRCAVVQIVPAYECRQLERAADKAAGVVPVPNWSQADEATRAAHIDRSWESTRIRQAYEAKIYEWCDHNAILRARCDAKGKVIEILGVDPEPFTKLLDAVAAGESDPIGIFAPPPARTALAATA